MNWFSQNANSIEAIAAIATAMIALVGLVGIKYQLDATDELQRSQSARDAYRSHLSLAATIPHFAKPDDVCGLLAGDQAGAYTAFVDHLIYSAEQMLDVEEGWESTFSDALEPHAPYMCSQFAPRGQTSRMARFMQNFKASVCTMELTCQ